MRIPLMGRTTPTLLLLLPLIVACGTEGVGDAAWAGTVSDSAGIPVVSNPSDGLWDDATRWTVEEELSVGSMEGSAAEQFGLIAGVDVDAEGRIYVLDQQASEVRVFDPEGAWLRTLGEPGAGPGQIGNGAAGVFVIGDHVLVPDIQNQRVNRYDPEGALSGSFRLDFTRGIPLRWDHAAGGGLMAQLRTLTGTDGADAPPGDVLVAHDSAGTVRDTVAVLPPGQSLQVTDGVPRFRFFEPEPIWDAAEDGRLASGMNGSFRVQLRGPDGELQRVVSLAREPRSVTERDRQVIADAVEEAMRNQGAPPQAIQMMMANATFAEHYPLFASLFLGPEGSLWVQRIRTGDELAGDGGTFDAQDLGSPDWDIFDEEGRYLGVVSFPSRYQPLRVVGERIYGVARDELDVQRLAVYRIRRP